MTRPLPQRLLVLAAVGSAGVIVALALGPAGAQVPPTTAPVAPADPTAPTTTVKPAAPKLPPGRRAPSKDPAVLAADGRNAKGVIVGPSPALDEVPVTSVEYDGAAKQRNSDAADLADANHRIATASVRMQSLELERVALVDLVARGAAREQKLADAQRLMHEALRSLAVQRFMTGSSEDTYPDPNQTIEEALERSHEQTLSSEAERRVETNYDTVTRRLESVRRDVADWTRRQRTNAADAAEAAAARTKAASDAQIATAALVGAEAEIRAARPMTVVTGSDLPLVALDAYWRAANDMAATRPTCRISWTLLAGIGRSESNHGRSTGGQPGPDGTLSVPVYGIPLDGTGGTRAVPDTDKGVLDLDPTFDRAVGVMQFIPGTWKRYAEDESGDKVADPQNIYDAALAAAKLLCTHGPGLDEPAAAHDAVFAYNHSEDYVSLVTSRAAEYATLPVPAPPAP